MHQEDNCEKMTVKHHAKIWSIEFSFFTEKSSFDDSKAESKPQRMDLHLDRVLSVGCIYYASIYYSFFSDSPSSSSFPSSRRLYLRQKKMTSFAASFFVIELNFALARKFSRINLRICLGGRETEEREEEIGIAGSSTQPRSIDERNVDGASGQGILEGQRTKATLNEATLDEAAVEARYIIKHGYRDCTVANTFRTLNVALNVAGSRSVGYGLSRTCVVRPKSLSSFIARIIARALLHCALISFS